MVVLALITRLFSGNSDENKQQKRPSSPTAMPPFSNERPSVQKVEPKREPSRPARPKVEVKSLEDFAQEVFGQLQQKAEQKPPVVTKVEPAVEMPTPTPSPSRAESTRPAFNNRAQLGAERPILQREKEKKKAVHLPKTREDLVQSVIMAEVLGAPKAKQQRRLI